MQVVVGNFVLLFEPGIQVKRYEETHCYGASFTVGDWSYDVVHNHMMGTRLLMTSTNFHWKDIPFKEATLHLLPGGVSAFAK